jgi:hypothetical protein
VSGVLAGFGFAVPFAFAAALGLVAFALVYTQVAEPSREVTPSTAD